MHKCSCVQAALPQVPTQGPGSSVLKLFHLHGVASQVLEAHEGEGLWARPVREVRIAPADSALWSCHMAHPTFPEGREVRPCCAFRRKHKQGEQLVTYLLHLVFRSPMIHSILPTPPQGGHRKPAHLGL